MFAAKAKAHVEKCSSGHSPQLSQPEMLVQKIHEASQKAVTGLAKEDVYTGIQWSSLSFRDKNCGRKRGEETST